uniref:Ig-like domain-containing protein n=1 Tax=Esox lucius TaxID=8010 RepID=A0AAY5L9I3_ESOLU
MDSLCVAVFTLLCEFTCVSLEVELIVKPGDNITLYCDCRTSTGVSITWFRNCSHEHQPTLVISLYWNQQEFTDADNVLKIYSGITALWNPSNNTYDLLIENITESDLGLYYCGTKENKVVDEGGKGGIKYKDLYHYGNITNRLSFGENNFRLSSRVLCLILQPQARLLWNKSNVQAKYSVTVKIFDHHVIIM